MVAITTEKGDKQGFIVDSTTNIYQGDTTKTINLSVIEIGDGISIEYDGSKAKVIRLVNDAVPSTLEVKGSIDDVTSSKITLVKSDKSTESYYFANDFDIKLDKKTISQKDLLDEFDEYVLDATLTLNGSGNIISVDVTKGKETGMTGILESISEDELSVKESKNSKTKDFEFSSQNTCFVKPVDITRLVFIFSISYSSVMTFPFISCTAAVTFRGSSNTAPSLYSQWQTTNGSSTPPFSHSSILNPASRKSFVLARSNHLI